MNSAVRVKHGILNPISTGCGQLEFAFVAGRTQVTRAESASPLRLLTPRGPSASAWAYSSTYGGGLVSGDRIRLHVRAGDGTVCFLGTQASTKVYRSAGAGICEQAVELHAEGNAVCIVAPDPVSPFAGADFAQQQTFELSPTATLVLVDCYTAGRTATGERWAFTRFDSRINVRIAGRLVFRDAVRLEPDDRHMPMRVGPFDCFGMALLLGPRVSAAAESILRYIASQPAPMDGPLLFAASPVAGGAVIRVAGSGPQAVTGWLRDRLTVVPMLLGQSPWERKA